MANYTVRREGTAANKTEALNGDPDVLADCMNITVARAQSYSGNDQVLLADTGGDYRGPRFNFPSSGTSGNPILWKNYPGDTPVLKGSYDLTDATLYKWTESVAKSGEWHVEAAAGGDPGLVDPDQTGESRTGFGVFLNDAALAEGTVGSLADHEWDWGNNDTLGYNTVYVRDDTGDPDTSGVQIEVSQIACAYMYGQDYVTVDGLIFKHAAITEYIGGFLASGDAQHVIVQNCEAHWCQGHGIMIKGDYCTIDNCISGNNGAHGLGAGGFEGNHSTYMTIKNSTSYNTRTIGLSGGSPYDGYGIKFLWCDDSSIHNNETYGCELEGINLDGSLGGGQGCERCDVYENDVHNNFQQGILVELFSDDCRVFRNRIYDNQTFSGSPPGEIGLTHVEGTEIFGNIIYRTEAAGGGANAWGIWIIDYSPGRGNACNTKIYGNLIEGGGYLKHCVYADGYDIVEGMQVFNNIFSDFTGYALYLTGQDYTGFDADYNVYQADDASPTVILYEGYASYTVITGGTGTWYATKGFGQNSINADPGFVNKSAQNFELDSDSPCINVGDNTLGSPYNVGILPGSTWPNPDTADQDDY